jgi:hypothetical protein
MADVTVRLALGNFSVEVTGEAEYVDKKIDDLVSRYLSWRPSSIAAAVVAEPAPGAVAPATAEVAATAKQISPAELVKKSAAKNQADRALILGYYLEKMAGSVGFTSSELVDLGRQIKQPFTNASDSVAKLSGRGLMMSTGNREGQRAYALTASGETYVESLLESEAQK